MKTFFLTLCALLMVFVLQATPVSAQKGGGDVIMHRDGDVLFLSTTATTSESAKSSTEATPSSRKSFVENLKDTTITIPKGFATNIGDVLNAVLSFVMLFGALLVFLQLILAGFNWITSGGEKGKVDAARQRLMAAIVGLIILASSYAILTIGLNFLGFESINDVFENAKTIR